MIHAALLVTVDGELLGISTSTSNTSTPMKDPASLGTLVAEIAADYLRLGEEFASVDAVHRSRSHLQCLLLELDLGTVGVAACGADCLVVAVAAETAPPGLVKARLDALALYVQEALSTLQEGGA